MIYVEKFLLHLMPVLSSLTINRRYTRIRRFLTHRFNQFLVANGQAHFGRVKQDGGANNISVVTNSLHYLASPGTEEVPSRSPGARLLQREDLMIGVYGKG